MVPNTSYLKVFKLMPFNDGFILQFEAPERVGQLNEAKVYPKWAQVFDEYSKWSRIIGVETVGSLNESVCRGESRDIIWTAEGLHEKKIADIADKIANKGRRLVMIAGPSSSGKTTFAKRLCIQLKVAGLKPYSISLDDYYRNRDDIEPEPDGTRNFERLEALDVKLFNEDLQNLLEGKTVQLPTFNFLTGRREYKGNHISLGEGEVLVIEGIHGINEKLTPTIDRSDKFKVYISALTQLNLDEHNRISTTDTRMIRRIVRDNQFRGFDAKSTIDIWPTVLTGEEMNIFPYQEEADAMFNSALVYELSVLKSFVEPALFGIDKNEREYSEAKRLLNFLNNFITISPSDIPTNSIMREFIGGSCFY
jgi:uridine kinase